METKRTFMKVYNTDGDMRLINTTQMTQAIDLGENRKVYFSDGSYVHTYLTIEEIRDLQE